MTPLASQNCQCALWVTLEWYIQIWCPNVWFVCDTILGNAAAELDHNLKYSTLSDGERFARETMYHIRNAKSR